MRSLLIINPTSGSSSLASNRSSQDTYEQHILDALRARGIEPEVQYTSENDTGSGLAAHAAASGVELVIVAGGDGTLHAVAGALAETQTTLGIIPLGTMNNVARSLQIPEDIDLACAIIAEGATARIDMGAINGQVFLEVAGIGLEAALFPAAEEIKRTGLWSTVRGVIHGLYELFRFRPIRFVVSFDGKRARRFHAIQISVCNTPFYGARFPFAPRAVMDDGLLDVLIYKNFSTLEYLRHAVSISQGHRTLEPKIKRRKIKSMHLRTKEPVPIHIDGEPFIPSSQSEGGSIPSPTAHAASPRSTNGKDSPSASSVSVNIRPGVLQVRVPQPVAAGPDIVHKEKVKKQRRHVAGVSTLEERGPQHVS